MIITTNITFEPLCKLNLTAGLFERWLATCLLVAGCFLNSGGYLWRCEVKRFKSTAVHQPWGKKLLYYSPH